GHAIEHELTVLRRERVTRHDGSYRRQWIGSALVAGIVQIIAEVVVTTLAVIRCDERFPSDAVIERQMARDFPTVLNVSADIRLPRIQKALCAGGEAGWQSQEKIRKCQACPIRNSWNGASAIAVERERGVGGNVRIRSEIRVAVVDTES